MSICERQDKTIQLTVFCTPRPRHLSLTLNSRLVEVTRSTRRLVNDRWRLDTQAQTAIETDTLTSKQIQT